MDVYSLPTLSQPSAGDTLEHGIKCLDANPGWYRSTFVFIGVPTVIVPVELARLAGMCWRDFDFTVTRSDVTEWETPFVTVAILHD